MWQVLKAGIIFSTIIGLIVWIGRPDLFDQQIFQPFRNAQAREAQQRMDAAKKEEFNQWMKKISLPAECNTNQNALKQVECKNKVDLHIKAFEENWRRKIAAGYQP
jgi:uncharacterized membrane protein (DUF106 family)